MTATKRTALCTCGGDIFEKELERAADGWSPIWRCSNCSRETPRLTRRRKSNRMRALDAAIAIRAEWDATDDALRALVAADAIKSGALLVHASAFNWHLKQLSDIERPTSWDVRYHAEQARGDLAKAKALVAAEEKE